MALSQNLKIMIILLRVSVLISSNKTIDLKNANL